MNDKNACSSCGFKGARLWAVPGVDVVYCVACCPLSANGYPAVWEGERLKTPTQITDLEIVTWKASPLWPAALQRAWLLKQMEAIAVAGAQLAARGEGDWRRPIRTYLAPELREVAAPRGLGVEALTPEDWEDFAARFDMLISIARVEASKAIPRPPPRAKATEAVTIYLGSIGWGRGEDLPWQGVEGEAVATYLAAFIQAELERAGDWHAVETLEIRKARARLVVYAGETVPSKALSQRWETKINAIMASFLDPSNPLGWRSFFELDAAARPSKGAS